MSKKILFFGNERLATGITTSAPTLRALIESNYHIVGLVVAQKDIQKSRKFRDLEIIEIANQYNIPVLVSSKLIQIQDQINALKPDIGVLVAFGKLVPQAIIDIFPYGIINIHPSLLPLHRGPTPIESVMLQGDTKTGVSLMQLTSRMDSGNIYAQEELDIAPNVSKQYLADKLSKIGSELLMHDLPGIFENRLKPTIQDDLSASYDHLLTKEMGRLDWTKFALSLEREIRAFIGWPRSSTTVNGQQIIVTQAHVETLNTTTKSIYFNTNQRLLYQNLDRIPGIVVENASNTLGFTTGKDLLMIDALIPSGKKEMSISAFLAGLHRYK